MDTLTSTIGLQPIVPVKVSVTIGTMLNFDDVFDENSDLTCEQTLTMT